MIITLTRRICLESKYLDSNIHQHLLNKLKTIIKEDDCSLEHGYILSIICIVKIVNFEVSSANSDNVCILKFKADVLKPKIGDILEGNVNMICDKGIFLIIKNKFRVFIPVEYLKGYIYSNDNKTYTNDKKHIKNEDILKVEIIGVKYSNKKFNCYGQLKEVL